MNILPKKRWHVRTKDNIARVRKDEAEAREKEDKRLEKLKFAESEARINFLRRQTGLPERHHDEVPQTESTAPNESSSSTQHVDLFADYKTHVKTTNKDLEKEKKEEREKYEKQIGYLTYLGQDTNEALKLRSWYETAPKRDKEIFNADTEKDMKNKFVQDPLTLINALLPTEKRLKVAKEKTKSFVSPENPYEKEESPKPKEIRKHREEKKSKKKKMKKEKHTKRDRGNSKSHRHKNKKKIEKDFILTEEKKREQKRNLLDRLRKERLKREAAERERQNELLKPPEIKIAGEEKKSDATISRIVQKYNSQFNPEIAKQNML